MDDTATAELFDAVHLVIGDRAIASQIADDLRTRHAEPQRRYHTIEHVLWVLRHVDRLWDAEDTAGLDRIAVDAAALFHDAVYDPRSATNEADSAALAARWLHRADWAGARIAAVTAMIAATAGHEGRDRATAILLDADLAILGAPPDDYATYVDAVRFEYSFVDDDRWRTGRAAVVISFLERAHIFSTATMANEREQRARRNLTAELAGLRSVPG